MLLLNKEARIRLVLDADTEITAPPTFVYRPHSGHDTIQALEISHRAATAATPAEQMRATFDALQIGLVGWENLDGVTFDPGQLSKLLTWTEASELLAKLVAANVPDATCKKKFG